MAGARWGRLGLTLTAVVLCGCPKGDPTAIYQEERTDCFIGSVPNNHFDCFLEAYLDLCLSASLKSRFPGDGSVVYECMGFQCPESLCEEPVDATVALNAHGWTQVPGGALPWPSPAVPPTQRAALLAFFAATGGPNWFDKTGWGGPPGTECDWFGVTCNAARTSVTALSFFANNLVGKLPPEIGNFPDLQVLSLQDELLNNTSIPEKLTNLGNLTVLVLTGNRLNGALPSTIGKLSKLQMLVLHDRNLQQSDFVGPLPAGLWSLTGLRVLSLADMVRLEGALPADASKLKSLESLEIRDTGMSGPIPPSWASLTKLKSLVVSASGATGAFPSFVTNFKQLRRLSLDNNALTGALPAGLGGLTNLEILDLSFNQLTGPIPASLSDLDRLRLLRLVGNRLSGPLPDLTGFDALVNLAIGPAGHGGPLPASYLDLEQLQVLMLPKAGLTGPLPDLSLFSDLREVNLEDNAFAPGPMPSWVGALPDLTKVLLGGTNRQGAIPDLTIYQNQLSHLGLGRNGFAPGAVPAWLGQMFKLRFLDLEKTNRNGALPAFLTDLGPFVPRFLDLSDNPFTPGPVPDFTKKSLLVMSLDLGNTGRTGPLPAHFAGMAALQRLALNDNQLTGPISKAVLPPRAVQIDLRRNRLSGPLPATLGEENQLVSLLLAGNQLSGPVPTTLLNLQDLQAGAIEHPLFGKLVGLDLRWNALTATDPTLVNFLKTKHEGGVDFRASQTVAPAGGKAVALGATSVKVSWTPIVYKGPGKYTVLISKSVAGPFTVAGQVGPKSAATLTLTGLQSKTEYYFQLTTTTNPKKQDPGGVTSLPSAVFSVTTK